MILLFINYKILLNCKILLNQINWIMNESGEKHFVKMLYLLICTKEN